MKYEIHKKKIMSVYICVKWINYIKFQNNEVRDTQQRRIHVCVHMCEKIHVCVHMCGGKKGLGVGFLFYVCVHIYKYQKYT